MSYIKLVVKEAAQNGTLVYYMNQKSTVPMKQPGPWGNLAGGYCGGLTVRWIRLAYAGRDYPTTQKELEGVPYRCFEGSDWQATVYQNKLDDYVGSSEVDLATQGQYTLALAQMQLGTELREAGNCVANGQRLSRVLAKSYGCYWVGLMGATTAHAVAMRHARPSSGSGPGELHIFDPNYGHFMWQARAATWPGIIDWYLGMTDYWKEFTSNYLIARATPPVNHGHA